MSHFITGELDMLSYSKSDRFVNLKKVSTDIVAYTGNNFRNQKFIVSTPMQDNVSVVATSMDNLVIQLMKLSKHLPHNSCAIIYKIQDSNIKLDIYPVTDAA
jgi:hypothetical protein